jgi:hypothetical protein
MAEITRVKMPICSSARLHGQRVHHRGQHAHVVGRRALHPLRRALKPAEDVAAADDHANLDPQVVDRLHLLRDALHRGRVQAIALIAHQRLARDFQKDALVAHDACFAALACRAGHALVPRPCFLV